MEKRSSLEKKKSKTSHVSETLALIQVTAEYLSKTRDSENNDLHPLGVWILRIHGPFNFAFGQRIVKSVIGLIFPKKRIQNPQTWTARYPGSCNFLVQIASNNEI